jgi:DNA-binding LacI/PurR family transcriptional regulator
MEIMARLQTLRRRPRLKEVATLAGVSTMTVTRALNAPHKVAKATRVRVEAIARDLGYTPDLTREDSRSSARAWWAPSFRCSRTR